MAGEVIRTTREVAILAGVADLHAVRRVLVQLGFKPQTAYGGLLWILPDADLDRVVATLREACQ